MTAEEREPIRQAARDYAAGTAAALDRALAPFQPAGSVREPGPYGVGSGRSYFLDLLWSVGGESQLRDQIPGPLVGSMSEARARLSSGVERRDLTTSATQGEGSFRPALPRSSARPSRRQPAQPR